MIEIGFTGTRHGMSARQLESVRKIVKKSTAGTTTFRAHHGDCVGADCEFHAIAVEADSDAWTVIHPGPIGEHSAGCVGDDRHDPLPHMLRNRRIVAASTVMIATPFEATEQPRGGTWATIRIARKAGKPLAIAWPDGSVTKERWP